MLFYNAYLLIIKDKNIHFSIIRLQTDNTFNIWTEIFMNKKEEEITKAKFKAKLQKILETGAS